MGSWWVILNGSVRKCRKSAHTPWLGIRPGPSQTPWFGISFILCLTSSVVMRPDPAGTLRRPNNSDRRKRFRVRDYTEIGTHRLAGVHSAGTARRVGWHRAQRESEPPTWRGVIAKERGTPTGLRSPSQTLSLARFPIIPLRTAVWHANCDRHKPFGPSSAQIVT
jgi:hypothetical protein